VLAFLFQSSQSVTSRNYPADTAKQRFIEENYNKETSIRLGWYFSRKGTEGDEQSGANSRQKEVCRKRIEDACPRPTSSLLRLRDRFDNPVDYRKRAFRIDGLPTSGEWTRNSASTRPPLAEQVPDMVPPDQTTKAKLYEGFSHDGKGRVDYLKTRSSYFNCVRVLFLFCVLFVWLVFYSDHIEYRYNRIRTNRALSELLANVILVWQS